MPSLFFYDLHISFTSLSYGDDIGMHNLWIHINCYIGKLNGKACFKFYKSVTCTGKKCDTKGTDICIKYRSPLIDTSPNKVCSNNFPC